MKPLIDADILRYEIGFSGQIKETDEEGNKKESILPFETVKEILDQRIRVICEQVGATEAPTLFLTGDKYLYEKHLKKDYVPNFREAMSTLKEYKGTRKQEKPFHFYNITEYILAVYDTVIAEGYEADDLICSYQYGNWLEDGEQSETIICSRDKDLRMCPGWHYSWECGKQAEIGPMYVDPEGWIERKDDGKVFATGISLLYYQCLAGDVVDNIPGLPKYGPVKAFKLISECKNEQEMFNVVRAEYEKHYGEDWKKQLKEQINLLWIVQEFDKEGNPIFYNPKDRGLL